ncbi:MAG: hypothetical protein H7066_19450 [Cytophagaceae bacterium]|nr:hypothetical protein [Gemmatimonadaceae bacterium]
MIRLASLVVLAAVLPFRTPPPAQGSTAQLRWLAGCHELRAGSRIVHEQWMAPLGGMMMGMSRTVSGDTVREFEHLRIETRGGKPTYVAHPSGQAESAFAAETVSDTLVVFANPAHDFPQKISYRKVGSDSIIARIEGPRGGQVRGINFPMRRVPCP